MEEIKKSYLSLSLDERLALVDQIRASRYVAKRAPSAARAKQAKLEQKIALALEALSPEDTAKLIAQFGAEVDDTNGDGEE